MFLSLCWMDMSAQSKMQLQWALETLASTQSQKQKNVLVITLLQKIILCHEAAEHRVFERSHTTGKWILKRCLLSFPSSYANVCNRQSTLKQWVYTSLSWKLTVMHSLPRMCAKRDCNNKISKTFGTYNQYFLCKHPSNWTEHILLMFTSTICVMTKSQRRQ